MLLLFPGVTLPVVDDTKVVRSLNKEEFHSEINRLESEGWKVVTMSTNFRQALFGGVVSYVAELKRGSAQQASST